MEKGEHEAQHLFDPEKYRILAQPVLNEEIELASYAEIADILQLPPRDRIALYPPEFDDIA